jgi:hypothetical protein
MNIGLEQGGAAANSIPDYCMKRIDFRICKDEHREVVLRHMQQIVDSINKNIGQEIAQKNLSQIAGEMKTVPGAVYRENFFAKGVQNENDISFIESLTSPKTTESYCTDASYINHSNVVIVGPGGGTEHKPNENVSIAQLEQCAELFKQIIEKEGSENKIRSNKRDFLTSLQVLGQKIEDFSDDTVEEWVQNIFSDKLFARKKRGLNYVNDYYGLNENGKKKNREEIAADYDITPSGVQQTIYQTLYDARIVARKLLRESHLVE